MSNIFTKDRTTADLKVILNIKELNEHIKHLHFKMNTTENVLEFLSKHYFMVSINLKDTCFVIPIASDQRKFCRFFCKGNLYHFCCLPFGLSTASRVFIKLMKPTMLVTRWKGHKLTDYIDDIWLMGRIISAAQQNIYDTKTEFINLGIIINNKKLMLTPTKWLEHLGLIIDSSLIYINLNK